MSMSTSSITITVPKKTRSPTFKSPKNPPSNYSMDIGLWISRTFHWEKGKVYGACWLYLPESQEIFSIMT
jgi:hypothetical protein